MPQIELRHIGKSLLSGLGLMSGMVYDYQSYATADRAKQCRQFYPKLGIAEYNCQQNYSNASWMEWTFSKLGYSFGIIAPLVLSPDQISRREMFGRIYAAATASTLVNLAGSTSIKDPAPILEQQLTTPRLPTQTPTPRPTRIAFPGYL
jgi:hypothetical protein